MLSVEKISAAPLTVATTMPPGGGAGSSTASALAAMRAVLAAANAAMTPERESALLLAVEGAVDPLAFPSSPLRLWASRRAETVEVLPPPPPLWVAGAFDGPGSRTDPADDAFPDMAETVEQLRQALAAGDAAALGAAATASARPIRRAIPSAIGEWPRRSRRIAAR